MSVLNVSQAEGVLRLEINRPEARNALNLELMEELHKEFDQALSNQDIKGIILSGAGDKAFCAGADLSETDQAKIFKAQKLYGELLVKLESYTKPVVAKVHGSCMGGGLGLALSCHIIAASEDADFGTPEVKVGLFPLMISPLVYRHFGKKKGDEMMLLGQVVSAAEAYRVNVINACVTKSELDATIDLYAKTMSSLSSQVVGFGIKTLKRVEPLSFPEKIMELSKALGEMVQLEDTQEGIRAFKEKRKPNYRF